MVQAAGDHRAVPQHADVVPQALAEAGLSLVVGVQVGPLEPLPPLQIDPGGQGGALPALLPGPGEGLLQAAEDDVVAGIGPLGGLAI